MHDEQFRLVHAVTGAPLPGVSYRIAGPTGVVRGRTDHDGRSERVVTGSAAQGLAVEFLPEAPASPAFAPFDIAHCSAC